LKWYIISSLAIVQKYVFINPCHQLLNFFHFGKLDQKTSGNPVPHYYTTTTFVAVTSKCITRWKEKILGGFIESGPGGLAYFLSFFDLHTCHGLSFGFVVFA
jgi:hypothetical protein